MEVLRELLEFINNWDVSGISHGLMGYNDIRERIFRLNIGYLKIAIWSGLGDQPISQPAPL